MDDVLNSEEKSVLSDALIDYLAGLYGDADLDPEFREKVADTVSSIESKLL